MKLTPKMVLIVAPLAAVAVAVGVGGGIALAANSAAAPSPLFGCINLTTRTISAAHTASAPTCPKGTFPFQTGAKGATGAAGAKGATGTTGATGPSGVQAVINEPLTATAGVPTGGSFNAKAVQVGTAKLPAKGTYLLNLSAQSEPSADTSSAGVQPQFFVYDQPKNANFTGDLLNIGSGTLAPAGTEHDSYASGTAVVTVDGPTTLLVYGFGYDNDSGASDFNLITGSISAVQLTPAG